MARRSGKLGVTPYRRTPPGGENHRRWLMAEYAFATTVLPTTTPPTTTPPTTTPPISFTREEIDEMKNGNLNGLSFLLTISLAQAKINDSILTILSDLPSYGESSQPQTISAN